MSHPREGAHARPNQTHDKHHINAEAHTPEFFKMLVYTECHFAPRITLAHKLHRNEEITSYETHEILFSPYRYHQP